MNKKDALVADVHKYYIKQLSNERRPKCILIEQKKKGIHIDQNYWSEIGKLDVDIVIF